MKLKKIANNVTLITIDDQNEILFSYNTPVAGFTSNKELPGHTKGYFRTDKKWSVTTSKHINQYLNGNNATFVPQQVIDSLLGSN